jgi:hypothetical protein
MDWSYRNPLDARSAREIEVCTRQSSGGITLRISVSEIQESHFPGEAKVETFRLKRSKRLKAQEERYRPLGHGGESTTV